MIYNHSHLPLEITSNKITHHISRDNPLIIILSRNFLSKTLENTLKIKKIPFVKKVVSESILMEHKLPLLAYQNTVLTQQQIVEFLADLWYGDLNFQQYIQRKQICLEIYNKWTNLLFQENNGVSPQKIRIIKGIKNKQDYHNYVFSGFVLLSSQIKGGILQRVYDHYRFSQVNLQNLLTHDLITTICNECPTSLIDHILRGHFIPLLQTKQKIEEMLQKQLQAKRQYEIHQISILTDQKAQEKTQNKNFSFNWKRFVIGFGITSSIYYFWGGK